MAITTETGTPKASLDPYLASACINVAGQDLNGTNWSKHGKNCTNLGNNYYDVFCWCCCSCFANGTLIASPTGAKKIEDYQVGDKVLAAGITGAAGSTNLEWSPARVGFSFGTSDGTQQGMVYLRYGSGTTMICTPDQLFLLATGKMIRADRLVPGRDQFVSPGGTPVALYEISLGVYKGGVHHIATKPDFKGDLQGHLLNSAGIVAGDFDLQIRRRPTQRPVPGPQPRCPAGGRQHSLRNSLSATDQDGYRHLRFRRGRPGAQVPGGSFPISPSSTSSPRTPRPS